MTLTFFPAGAFRETTTFATSSDAMASAIDICGAGSSSSITSTAVLLSREAFIGFERLIIIVSLSSLEPSLAIAMSKVSLVELGAN